MRKVHIQIIAFFIFLGLYACDKIERPEAQIKTNELNGDTVAFPAIAAPYQKIFLEEFTGHTCVNCPKGHKIAADLKARYGDTIVLMAIHAGIFAKPEPNTIYTADYRTEAGTEINDSYGVQGYPSGLINRTPYLGMTLLGTSAWSAAANAINRTSPKMAIQIKTAPGSESNSHNIFVKSTFLEPIQQNIKLAIFIIEDSLVSPQTNNNASLGTIPDIESYTHRHMLRGAVNSAWGAEIATNASISPANSFVVKGYSYSLAGKPFVASRCYIIAVAYNVDSKQVIQVEETHLVH